MSAVLELTRRQSATMEKAAVTPTEAQVHACISSGQIERALELLMQAYGAEIHRYCWGLLRQRELAEDVLQTVFVQAHEHLPAFAGRSSFKTWLYGIARHRCFDELRRRRRWARLVNSDNGESVDLAAPEVDPDVQTIAAQLQHCLGAISDSARDLVMLRFRHELSYEYLAVATGSNAGALRVRVCRVLGVLKRCLEQRGVVR